MVRRCNMFCRGPSWQGILPNISAPQSSGFVLLQRMAAGRLRTAEIKCIGRGEYRRSGMQAMKTVNPDTLYHGGYASGVDSTARNWFPPGVTKVDSAGIHIRST
ncbi:hypothetical protein Poly21_11290 [Allorhodopirellula heiligendammensis]|uniref:Uncharacterized protein n=1 Tax=Allorhodopirellula heiligendammensis TaxID=2714739 RepID=A0A5C6C454_9BACT|nr:hypothetical protein Poly21_11290 [Allorhodopirellula heiligendammensis]